MMPSSPLMKAAFHPSWLFAVLCFLGSSASAQTCVQPPAGLVSWWPGDGNAQDIIGPNDGTLQGGTAFAPGIVEEAFSFDGTNDYVSVADNPALDPTSAITVEVWINPSSHVGSFDPIVKKAGEGLDQSHGYALEFLGNDVVFWVYLSGGAAWQASTSAFVPFGTWTHVAGVYDGSAIRLYVNGALAGSPTFVAGSIVRSKNPLNIGRDPANPDRLYHGLIDEVSLYNRALTADEIHAIFDEGSAAKCKDSDVTEVQIDIKPGSSPNSINPKSNGVIPVALLTTETFDVTTVDPLSVHFGPKGAKEAHNKGHIEDVNHDGEPDLVLHFKTQATGIKCGDTSASLTGETFDGNPIQGSDAIKTVGCKKK
jgi:hypothetical protein